jgi:hypothetical protein
MKAASAIDSAHMDSKELKKLIGNPKIIFVLGKYSI